MTAGRPAERPRWQSECRDAIGVFGVVFIAYLLGAWLGWKSFGSAVGPAFFYPSAGVTVAAMMLTRRTRWPAIVVAIVLAEGLVDLYFGNPPAVAAGYALANVVEPLIGASITLRWCRGVPDLRDRKDFAAFVAGACVIAPVFGGLIGGTVASWSHGSGWFSDVLQWWAGDGVGVLVTAAPILLWSKQYAIVKARPLEAAVVVLLASVLSVAAFWSQAQPSMLILPVLAWAALRLDVLGAALTGMMIAFVATTMTSRGRGVFSEMNLSPASQLAVTQLFVAVLLLVSLLMAQEAAARLQALRDREAERREQVRLRSVSDLALHLSAALTPTEIGLTLERQLLADGGADALSLGLLSRDGERLEWVTRVGLPAAVVGSASDGVPLADATMAAETVRRGQPILLRNRAEFNARYPQTSSWFDGTGAQTLASWPLDAGGRPIGVMQLMWRRPQPLDAAQCAYFSAAATMVGQALVRARAYADDHARAAVLQSAVLPAVPGDADGLEICVGYEPTDAAHGVCGDWYDVMPLSGNRTYLAVGDVVGHGLSAVTDMAQLRSAARALAIQGLPASGLLAELNSFTRHASKGRLARLTVATFDSAAAVLRYGLAGNPPPLLRRKATGQVTQLSSASGPALGPLTRANYTEGLVQLQPGDIVLFYTDGLVERRGTRIEAGGASDIDAGIAEAEMLLAEWDPNISLSAASASLHQMLAPRPRVDDVCTMVIRVISPGP
ncbi:MAG: SpoIIE family protein phosphatase [Mycobacterium sp.]|nr:SpoIIE family protein phosphatase [Mycobacterium sp.]